MIYLIALFPIASSGYFTHNEFSRTVLARLTNAAVSV